MVTYTYNPKNREIEVDISGEVDLEQIMKYLEALDADGEILPGSHEVVRVRRSADIRFNTSEAVSLVSRLAGLVERNRIARSTYITSNDVTYGVARMFQALAETVGHKVRIER